MNWIPVDILPPDRILVLVTGRSGVSTYPRFVITAYYSAQMERWYDVTNTPLRSNGFVVDYWAVLPELPNTNTP